MAGTDKSRSTYRGLLLMDPRITGVVASGDSTYSTLYTQQGEAYDTPVPLALTDDMVLQSSGTPEVAGQTFTITTQRAGFPGRAKGGFIWERATDAAAFGWENPNVTAGWEAIQWTDGGSYPKAYEEPDAVTLSDGTVIGCASNETASGVYGIVTWTWDPTTGTWGSAVTIDSSALYEDAHPCMVVLPDDRVLLIHWVKDTDSATRSVRVWVTADAGVSWDAHANYALADTIPEGGMSEYYWYTRTGRLRACYLNGDIVLFGWLEFDEDADGADAGDYNKVLQWASSDLGASFHYVTILDRETYPDCTVVDGTILLGTIDVTATDVPFIFRRIGTAFQPASQILSEIDPLSGDDFGQTGAGDPAGDLSIWTDEDGTVYAIGQVYAGGNKEGHIWRSLDAGLTWENVGRSFYDNDFGQWWRTADTTPSYPTGMAATHCRGSQVVLHNWVAPVGDEDKSVGAFWLGGYSTVTNPFHDVFKTPADQAGWSEMWVPFELPSDVDVWTKTATGSEALTSGALVITTTAQTNYYTATPTLTSELGLIVQWELQCSIGGSTSSEFVAMRATIGNGSHGFKLSVRCSTTGFRAYDNVASTALGTGTTSVDLQNKWVTFRLYMASETAGTGTYALYYRVNDGPGSHREWTLAVSGANLTDAAGATTSSVVWGHPNSTTSISRWRHLFYSHNVFGGRYGDHAQSGGQASPTDLNWHDYAPVPVSVANGLKLRAVDGPTFLGSEWTISSRYEYAIEKILPTVEPSPSEGWRSTADDTTLKIDFELNGSGDTEPLNDTIGIYLDGINWCVGAIAKYDNGSWTDIDTFDLRAENTGFGSLTYINNNGAVRAGTGTEVGAMYFGLNELAGGVIRFGTTKARRILGNTEGFWQATTSGVTKQVTIWFEPDGSESASGTDLSIVPPQCLILLHMAAGNARAYRLRIITGTPTPEGYFTLNKCVIGPVVVFGKDSDWGRKYGLEPVTTIIENANGNRRSRKMNRPRRSVELPWTDGIDQTQVSGSTAASTSDYLLGSSTSGSIPVALRNDTAWQLEGLIDYTGGGHLPVVYCPRILKGTPDNQYHQMRRLSLYGRIVSDWAAEVVVGNEEENELVRVPGLTIEEER